jgi:hypothetical protein
MALLPSMRRVFAIVAIPFFSLTMMALLPLSMHRRPCRCQDSVITFITMALFPLIRNGVVALIAMVLLLSSS